ncbi:MAG: hypothetical protein ACMUIU_00190 [bacterium]
MKKLFFLLCPLFVVIFISLPCLSESCTQGLIRAMKEEGLNDQQIQLICKKAELYQNYYDEDTEDPYSKAVELFDQGRYDDVISELSPYCNENPDVIRPRILLARAYLEKCDIMKANGDKAYKQLIYTPYYMGKAMSKKYKHQPDVLYILAKSYLINNRPDSATRYIEKAIILAGEAPCRYYELKGDAYTEMRGNHISNLVNIEKAKESYKEALQKADNDSLKAKIQKKLDLIENSQGFRR